MRRKAIAVFMVGVFFLMIANPMTPTDAHGIIYSYYLDNFIADTGALNAVTAIYLNYRMYDTIFETLLLLVSVIGIIYFSRHEGDY